MRPVRELKSSSDLPLMLLLLLLWVWCHREKQNRIFRLSLPSLQLERRMMSFFCFPFTFHDEAASSPSSVILAADATSAAVGVVS